VQILGSQVPVTCPVVAVPSIDHDHTVSSAQEEQSEQTSAAVAPEGGPPRGRLVSGHRAVRSWWSGSTAPLSRWRPRGTRRRSPAGRPYGTLCSGAFGLHVYGLRPPTVDPVTRERMAVLCRGSNG
jgi:hypothetical protein